MSEPYLTLYVDGGPDIMVIKSRQRSYVEVFCAKSCKNVGNCSIYEEGGKVLCHLVDRRMPLGKVRQVFVVEAGTEVAPALMRVSGNHGGVKSALRAAGYSDPSVVIDMRQIAVSESTTS